MDKCSAVRSRHWADDSFSVSGFSMRPAPDVARIILRARREAVDAASRALGMDLPRDAFGTATAGACSVLWLGPDEWLLLASQAEALSVERQLTQALAGAGHSLVDVSHRDVGLALLGPKTVAALSAGCPLDLHPAVFAAGMCTRTLVGKAQIILWRLGANSFQIHTFRSFTDYVWRFLAQAAADLD